MKDNPGNNTVDCIVDINGTHTVLIKRDHDPYKGYWALPGGRQHIGETLDDAVIRELGEETGLQMERLNDPADIPALVRLLNQQTELDQVRTYFSGSDPRGGNTTVYAVRYDGDEKMVEKSLKNGDDASEAKVVALKKLPQLAFDHYSFLKHYYTQFKKYRNPYPTTDVIIEHNDGEKEGIVLITRKNPPYGIAIPGGFAEYGLSLEENAKKEAWEETGLKIELENPEEPLCVHSDPKRDPRGHMISVTYIAKGRGRIKAGDDAKTAKLYSISEVIGLLGKDQIVFDHEEIIRKYLKHRRYL